MKRSPLPLLLALVPALAGAHPLGNFTTNRWAALTVSGPALDVRFGRCVPVASALVIPAAGLAIVAQALAQIGV